MKTIIRNNSSVSSSKKCASFHFLYRELAKLESILDTIPLKRAEALELTSPTVIGRRHNKASSNNQRLMKLLFLTILSLNSFSQENLYHTKYMGINLGINLAVGTHVQRLGFVCNAYYVNDHFQANGELRLHFNFKNLGPKKHYFEAITSLGVLYGYDVNRGYNNPFLNSVSNQTRYRSSIAYSYNAYWNKIGTTQQTGIIALQFDRITFITENDILARQTLDRFRTGAFLLQFQNDSLFQAAINCSMWTGQMGHKQTINNPNIYPQCYMDTVDGKFTNYSHGLLSAQLKYNIGYSQIGQGNFGIDAEKVRNVMQNKIIHDMRFLPKKWIKHQNCHIPMLDEKGNQYLYLENQKIKPAKVYFNLGSNERVFY